MECAQPSLRRRRGVIWAAVVVVVAAVWTVAGLMIRPAVSATLLYGIAPWEARGPAPQITVVGSAAGDCLERSRVTGRADAYRCHTAAGLADPCFAPPVYSEATYFKVLCPAGGSVTRFNMVSITGLDPLPAGARSEFAVRLADGQTCWATGTTGLLRYRCPAGTLQGPLHGTRTRRTAQYLPTGQDTAQTMQVTVTYR
ncbi:hypothetical protein [Streptomyces prunicolor]|uniref:hypothetical protein n=1 Tax=Streptomyces prunicolor TaxID=67348 RepID=UPI0034400502